MRIPIRKLILVGVSVTFCIAQSGCASGPSVLPPPLSEEARAQLGTIGTLSTGSDPQLELRLPAKGAASGAGIGAGSWTRTWWRNVPGTGTELDLLVLALWIGLTPVVAVSGSMYGAGVAEPAEVVEEAEAALREVPASLRILQSVRDYIFETARDWTRHQFVLVTERAPQALTEAADYSSLRDRGIDTVLELSVPTFGLRGEWAVNPPVTPFVSIRTRLIRTSKSTVVYDSTVLCLGGTQRFTEWVANNAETFRDELTRCYQSLGSKIVEEVFLLYLLPEKRASIVPDDTATDDELFD